MIILLILIFKSSIFIIQFIYNKLLSYYSLSFVGLIMPYFFASHVSCVARVVHHNAVILQSHDVNCNHSGASAIVTYN